MRCCFPTSCSIFFFKYKSPVLQLLPFSYCSVVLSGSEIITVLGSDIVARTVVMNQSLRFFSHSIRLQWLHRIVRWFIPWWACGIPGKDNLFTCTTVYNNWGDSLILISHCNVRGEAKLFYTVKSYYRLWYTSTPFPFAWWDKRVHLLGYFPPPLAMFP